MLLEYHINTGVCSNRESKPFLDRNKNAKKYVQKQNISLDKNMLWIWEIILSIFYETNSLCNVRVHCQPCASS